MDNEKVSEQAKKVMVQIQKLDGQIEKQRVTIEKEQATLDKLAAKRKAVISGFYGEVAQARGYDPLRFAQLMLQAPEMEDTPLTPAPADEDAPAQRAQQA